MQIERPKQPRALLMLLAATMLTFMVGCTEEKKQAAMPAPLVELMTVEAKNVPVVGDYVAQTAGSREVEVRARVTGILERRTYKEGSPIQRGTLMFEIDPATYKAALEQAEGDLAQQTARYKRAVIERDRVFKLYADNAVSQKDRDDAQTEFDAASAAMKAAAGRAKEARINLGYTRVEAPISGVTSQEVRSEGSLATTTAEGSKLTSITQYDPLYINFGMPNSDIMSHRRLVEQGKAVLAPEGLTVELVLADGSRYSRVGKVTFRDKLVDQNTGTVRTRAEVANPDAEILPGQYVRALVHGLTLKDAIMIPQRAILETQHGPMVYVVDANMVANLRPVVIADTLGKDYVIEKGVAPGDRIILEGIIKARPGQPVRVAQPAVAQNQPATSGVN